MNIALAWLVFEDALRQVTKVKILVATSKIIAIQAVLHGAYMYMQKLR